MRELASTLKIMNKKETASEPIGPYTPVVEFEGTLYRSRQIPVDPATGKIPDGIKAQIHLVLANLRTILKEAGNKLKNIVKPTLFLTDL